MAKQKILIQIDRDSHASSFDAIVAIDSGVDQLLPYSKVTVDDIQGLVHGAMFTRGPKDLHQTAIFFGGSEIQQVEELVAAAQSAFFGPMRVSLMSDPNGSNTTAAAAVLSAEKHIRLEGASVAVLGGTGPVGARIARICASGGAEVKVASRKLDRAESVCESIRKNVPDASLVAIETSDAQSAVEKVAGCQAVFAAGAAGVELLSAEWQSLDPLPRVLVDVNAVPPSGMAGVEVMDNAKDRHGTIAYGAIGVGGLKMKIHRRCLQQLFESNDQVLDVSEIYQVGREIGS